MSEASIGANIRKDFSGSRLNELRNSGKIPSILYGKGVRNTSIYVDEKEFKQLISSEHGENVLIKLKVGSKKSVNALIKEIQINPVTMKIIHIDFGQIKLTEQIEVEIPIEVEGESPGVKNDGGVLEHILRKIKVKCLPVEIPDNFTLDVSHLEIGMNLKVSDIEKIKGMEILDDEESLVVNVVAPTEYKEPEEAIIEEEAEEPEVIGKKKEETEEVEEKATSKSEE